MKTLVQSKVVIVNSNGKVLILRRSASDERRPHQWDITGGGVDLDESPSQAGVREVKEETGIILKDSDLNLVYGMTELPAKGVSVTWLFFVAHTIDTDIILSEEHDAGKWVSLEKAIDEIAYERQKRALKYILDNDLLETA